MGTQEFAETVRRLSFNAHAAGLVMPAFRSPPKINATRTIRHHQNGVVVSVRLDDRPNEAIVADMVDGIIAANDLTGEDIGRYRALLSETLF